MLIIVEINDKSDYNIYVVIILKAIKRAILILIIIISLFSIFMINGLIENLYVRKQIHDFKARGVLVYETDDTKYYEVRKMYDYEDNTKHVLTDYSSPYVGFTTDIFVTSRNPLPGSVLLGTLSHYIWIGHAGIVIDPEGKQTIEITGTDVNNSVVSVYENTWLNDSLDYTKEIVLLRVKNMDEEKAKKTVDYLESKIGSGYNYSFLFNRSNTFYCTDLVSRAIASSGINVNYDYLATTGSDLIVSPNTYIVYYRERIVKDGRVTFNVYYLGKESY